MRSELVAFENNLGNPATHIVYNINDRNKICGIIITCFVYVRRDGRPGNFSINLQLKVISSNGMSDRISDIISRCRVLLLTSDRFTVEEARDNYVREVMRRLRDEGVDTIRSSNPCS